MSVHVQSYFSEAVLGEIPHLRAYARMMTNDRYKADYEVEETLKRAPSIMDRMTRRSELRVQLLIILRSFLICSEHRHWRRDFNGSAAAFEKLNRPFRAGNGHAERSLSLATALVCLDFEDREAVVLSAGVRLPNREAARICGCEVSVYHTRLGRGLARLAELFPEKRFASRRGAMQKDQAASTYTPDVALGTFHNQLSAETH